MIRLRRPSKLVAIVEPSSLHLVHYRERGSLIELLDEHRTEFAGHGIQAAADALASLADSAGGRGGEVVVVIRGFGVTQHVLQLPNAPPEVWSPIVRREVERLDGAEGPRLVGFVQCGREDRGGVVQHDLLVGVTPEAVPAALVSVLRGRKVRLSHLTIVPQAVRQALRGLHPEGVGDCVVLTMVSSGAVLCFFHQGELRLVIEPVLGGATGEARANVIRDAIARGLVHLRQRFRGARPDRLLVAMHSEADQTLADDLQRLDAGDMRVEALGASSSLLALGAALDSGEPDPLDLRPEALGAGAVKPAGGKHRPMVYGAVGAAAVWAMYAWGFAWARSRDAAGVDAGVLDRAAVLERIVPVLQERRDHEERVALLNGIRDDERRVGRMLLEIARAASEVHLDSLGLTREQESWAGVVAGNSLAADQPTALRAINRFNAGLEAGLATSETVLEDFQVRDSADGGRVIVSFQISFRLAATPAEDE